MHTINGFHDEEYEKIIKKYWEMMSIRYITNNKIHKLKFLLRTGFLTYDELRQLLEYATEHNYIISAAYIAEAVKSARKEISFTL